jgi:hypothetical protein
LEINFLTHQQNQIINSNDIQLNQQFTNNIQINLSKYDNSEVFYEKSNPSLASESYLPPKTLVTINYNPEENVTTVMNSNFYSISLEHQADFNHNLNKSSETTQPVFKTKSIFYL